MIPLLAQKHDELVALCHDFRVARLELFGSAVSGEYRPGESDLDFAVEFPPLDPQTHARCYFGLLAALESTLGCSIDLVEMTAVRNPYVRASIEASRELLYAA